MTKKRTSKKPEIDIKIRNIDPSKNCYHHHTNFWIFGSALAMVISYERSASILWAILHGILSWFYILFRAIQGWGWF
jgi:hypothetical protein